MRHYKPCIQIIIIIIIIIRIKKKKIKMKKKQEKSNGHGREVSVLREIFFIFFSFRFSLRSTEIRP